MDKEEAYEKIIEIARAARDSGTIIRFGTLYEYLLDNDINAGNNRGAANMVRAAFNRCDNDDDRDAFFEVFRNINFQ